MTEWKNDIFFLGRDWPQHVLIDAKIEPLGFEPLVLVGIADRLLPPPP